MPGLPGQHLRRFLREHAEFGRPARPEPIFQARLVVARPPVQEQGLPTPEVEGAQQVLLEPMREHPRTPQLVDTLWSPSSSRRPTSPRRQGEPGQYTSIRYGERLAELGAQPSIGSIGDSFDNALAESTNSLYKTELIRGPDQGPWRTIEDVELATLGWVHWFNNDRIHRYLDDTSPDQFEAAYAASQTDHPMVGIQ